MCNTFENCNDLRHRILRYRASLRFFQDAWEWRGLLAFNIPSYSLIQKNNKTIEAPGFNSDTHKISVTKFTKFLIPTGEFLVQDVEKLTAYDSLSYTYGDFSCPEYTNNDLYTYVFTDF